MENSTLQSSKKPSIRAHVNHNEIGPASPFEILCTAEERINPAIPLAEELMLKAMSEVFDFAEIERTQEILIQARQEISRVENHFTALVKTPPAPGMTIPTGF